MICAVPRYRDVILLLLSVLLLTLPIACLNREPVKIGFSGGLTGRLADLGLYGRNGAVLAVEEVNARGGVAGRKVELLIADDKQDPATARKVDRELIDKGVVAIIGHMTSAMSVAVLPLIEEGSVLYLSPTTATGRLAAIDDSFLRTITTNRIAISHLVHHVLHEQGLERIAVVYDAQNLPFTQAWADAFAESAGGGGNFFAGIPFVSGPGFSFAGLKEKILSHDPDGVVVVAAALDAAMICQQIRKSVADMPIFTTMWSMSPDFLQHGGSATEGVRFINWFDPKHSAASSKKFRRKYFERFGRMPTFAAHFAYEAAYILFYALEKTTDPARLKTTILEKAEFKGTQGKIIFDEYGDVRRPLYLMQVKDGNFTRIEKL